MKNNNNFKKYYLVAGAVSSFVVIFLLNSYIFKTTPGLTAPTLVFWGFLGANIVASFFFLRDKKSRLTVKEEFNQYWKLIGAVSFLTSAGVILWFFGVFQLGSGVASLLEKSNILFVFLLGIFFLKERLSIREFFYMGIAVMGILFIASIKGEITTIGMIAMLFSEFLYSIHSLLIRKFGQKTNTLYFVYLRSIFSFVIIGIIFSLLGKINFIDLRTFILVTISLFIGAFVGKYFYFEAHKYFPISRLGFFMLLESVLTIMGAYLFFGDLITWPKVIGETLIILGAGLLLREEGKN